jgi:hypothetical protein
MPTTTKQEEEQNQKQGQQEEWESLWSAKRFPDGGYKIFELLKDKSGNLYLSATQNTQRNTRERIMVRLDPGEAALLALRLFKVLVG